MADTNDLDLNGRIDLWREYYNGRWPDVGFTEALVADASDLIHELTTQLARANAVIERVGVALDDFEHEAVTGMDSATIWGKVHHLRTILEGNGA